MAREEGEQPADSEVSRRAVEALRRMLTTKKSPLATKGSSCQSRSGKRLDKQEANHSRPKPLPSAIRHHN